MCVCVCVCVCVRASTSGLITCVGNCRLPHTCKCKAFLMN